MTAYRTGRHLGRTVYRITGDGEDELVGLMDTPELGARVVRALNRMAEFEAAEQRPVDLGGDPRQVPPPGVSS